MNHALTRTVLEEEALAAYMQGAVAIGQIGYKGLDISVFKHDSFPHTRVFVICGLGHTMHIMYVYDKNNQDQPALANMDDIFEDFSSYVLHEREQTHATIN